MEDPKTANPEDIKRKLEKAQEEYDYRQKVGFGSKDERRAIGGRITQLNDDYGWAKYHEARRDGMSDKEAMRVHIFKEEQ